MGWTNPLNAIFECVDLDTQTKSWLLLMDIGKYVRNHGMVVGVGLFLLTGSGWFIVQNGVPLYLAYRDDQHEQSRLAREEEQKAFLAAEAAKKVAQERAERLAAAEEQRKFEAEQNAFLAAEAAKKAEQDRAERLAAAEEQRKFEVQQTALLLKELAALRRVQEGSLDRQMVPQRREMQDRPDASLPEPLKEELPAPNSTTNEPDVEERSLSPQAKEQNPSASEGSSVYSFSVFGRDEFQLCGYGEFFADAGSTSVKLENRDRTFPFRDGFRNWERKITYGEISAIFDGCAVSIVPHSSQGMKYLVVSEIKPSV